MAKDGFFAQAITKFEQSDRLPFTIYYLPFTPFKKCLNQSR